MPHKPVAIVWVQNILRLLLWLPTIWAQKLNKLKIFNFKKGNRDQNIRIEIGNYFYPDGFDPYSAF